MSNPMASPLRQASLRPECRRFSANATVGGKKCPKTIIFRQRFIARKGDCRIAMPPRSPAYPWSVLAGPLLATPAGRDLQGGNIGRGGFENSLGTCQASVFFGGNASQQFEKLLNAFHVDD